MKKKIAVFANGWSNEYLELVLEGAKNRAAEDNIDLFVFLNYSSGSESDPGNVGESMIFSLPNIADFDAVLLMGNTINMAYERKELREKILKYKIPAISLEYPMQDIPYIGTDTYQGIYNLMLHVLAVHHAHDFVFMSGPRSNQESESRKRAVEDALETAGLVLREENIIEADWSYFVSYDKTIEYVNTHDKLPDAIVCANDEMAIGVCAALDFMKVRVPDDVIVTGCDYLRRGQDFFPILSTVGREWDKLGYQGMDMLIQQMNGAEIPMNTVLQSTPIVGESCGCNVSLTKSDERLHSIIANYRVQREDAINEWQLRYIDELFSKKNSVDGLKESMRNTFQDNHSFEGENFMLCIVDRYFEEKESWEELKLGELTERMDVYVNLVDGKAVITDKFPTKDLLPYYDGNTEETQVYLFIPLNTKLTSIGYMVQKNNLKRVYEQSIYVWLRRVSQDLERVKQNIRVEELNKKLKEVSITDALTGLRNRTGFDVLALPCLLECQKQGKHSAIVFADVNQMKLINDKHGHLQGDLALCTVAEAIKKALPENWVAVRYGGDEFLMVGECRDAQDADEITENLRVELETLKSKRRLSFNLSVSIGSVVMYPEENNNLEEYLRRADEAMYVAKQYFHETQASLI
ncbi:MAG: GGDEF domain-containing protein [Lachnospiraceae bacterium]|nr:GGDEF domain-containing protein [Lachnospiraceae bacterium]